MKRIYEVTFQECSNSMKDTVWDKDGDEYLDVEDGKLIVVEEDLSDMYKYKPSEIKYIGRLYERKVN